MSEVIKLDYELAEDMIKAFKLGREQFENVLQEVQSIANDLEGGILLGRSGESMVDKLRFHLSPKISKLIDTFDEMSNDVQKAVDFMRTADNQSKSVQQ